MNGVARPARSGEPAKHSVNSPKGNSLSTPCVISAST
jgi:hypothetical protein